jgi:excinuclease ABC subunit C
LHNIRQCTAPCNFRVTREEYRKQIRGLRMVLAGKKHKLIKELQRDMEAASAAMLFEKAARIRDEIHALQNLSLRGDVDKDMQPEVFQIEPKKGLHGLRKILGLPKTPRTIEGVDIAHLSGKEKVASLVAFIDGLPFKPGYRRYKIRTVEGVDDFASIREVISRRFRHAESRGDEPEHVPPDILLIDGGKGQLNAALEVFRVLGKEPPCLISLAKREEEIYRPGDAEPIRLSRHAAALRLLQYVRDEAHRFAQHYHHLLRRKKIED